MILLVTLTAVARCVSPALCPTDAELVAAVWAADNAAAKEIASEVARERPDEIVLVHPERVRRVSDVLCGNALPDGGRVTTCRFTARYSRRITYRVAELLWHNSAWKIVNQLVVSRNRR